MPSEVSVGVTAMNVSKEGIDNDDDLGVEKPKETEVNEGDEDLNTADNMARQILAKSIVGTVPIGKPKPPSEKMSVDVLFQAPSVAAKSEEVAKTAPALEATQTKDQSEQRPHTVATDGIKINDKPQPTLTNAKTEERPQSAEPASKTSDKDRPISTIDVPSEKTSVAISEQKKMPVSVDGKERKTKSIKTQDETKPVKNLHTLLGDREDSGDDENVTKSSRKSDSTLELDVFLDKKAGERVSMLDDDDDVPLLATEDSTTSLKKIIDGLDSIGSAEMALMEVNLGDSSPAYGKNVDLSMYHSIRKTAIIIVFSGLYDHCGYKTFEENSSSTSEQEAAVEPEEEINEALVHRDRDRADHLNAPEHVDGLFENNENASRSGFKFTPEEDNEIKTVSASSMLPSMHTTTDNTDEFMFIHPNDVLKALASFCKDYNAKIKV